MQRLLALALTVPLLAGCFGGDPADGEMPATATPLAAADIVLPSGAALEPIANGFAALWDGAALPFTTTVTVPAHATMVRLVAEGSAVGGLGVVNAETGRRRCNTPTVDSFS